MSLARNLALVMSAALAGRFLAGKRVHEGLHLVSFEERLVLLGHHVKQFIRATVGKFSQLLFELLLGGPAHVRFIRSTLEVKVQQSLSDLLLDDGTDVKIRWHWRCFERGDLLTQRRMDLHGGGSHD